MFMVNSVLCHLSSENQYFSYYSFKSFCVDLLQVFVFVSISNQNSQIKIGNLQEFIIPQAIWSMGIVSEKTGLVVSPTVIQYPYITQKTKGLDESLAFV